MWWNCVWNDGLDTEVVFSLWWLYRAILVLWYTYFAIKSSLQRKKKQGQKENVTTWILKFYFCVGFCFRNRHLHVYCIICLVLQRFTSVTSGLRLGRAVWACSSLRAYEQGALCFLPHCPLNLVSNSWSRVTSGLVDKWHLHSSEKFPSTCLGWACVHPQVFCSHI